MDNSLRILLLADLHFRWPWFAWAARQRVDLVAIAGDLADGFRNDGMLPQMAAIKAWCDALPVPLVVSSGNHDANTPDRGFEPAGIETVPEAQREAFAAMMMADRWMDGLQSPGVVTDGQSAVVKTNSGSLVVTSVPYSFDPGESTDHFWSAGAALRNEARVPWLVLHHEPPEATAVGGMMGDPALHWKLASYRPDYVLSGHLHQQPYVGSFADRIGETWCFNPGHPIPSKAVRAATPNHIILDLAAKTATWHATPNVGRVKIFKEISLP